MQPTSEIAPIRDQNQNKFMNITELKTESSWSILIGVRSKPTFLRIS